MFDRVVRVYPNAESWLLLIDDDWETMTEDERQTYIYEAALDNGKGGFEYGAPQPASDRAGK